MSARTILDLRGDISCLSALTSLQEFWLSNMKVKGDVNCLNAFTSPLCLDLSALAILQRLVLGLRKAKVLGDIGSAGARKVLDEVATPAMMTGVFNSPSALMSLQAHCSVVKESAAGLEGPLSRAARLSILCLRVCLLAREPGQLAHSTAGHWRLASLLASY